MKLSSYFIALLSFVLLPTEKAFSSETLYNCFSKRAQFLVHELEEIAQEKHTPILLLNNKNEVVGLMSVEPERAEKYPHQAKSVAVNNISLCSTLEVDRFYYTDGLATDLLDWKEASDLSELFITQDEGMLQMSVRVEREERYAIQMRVDFKAYDYVDPEETEMASEEAKAHPDFNQDWGLPKGTGTFYFYIPKSWKK